MSNEDRPVGLRVALRPVVLGRRRQMLAMSVSALAGAIAEAVVLVLITQVGFALAKGHERVTLSLGPASLRSSVGVAIVIAAALVILRGLLQTLNGWQSVNLVAGYLADTRKKFARAFVNTSLEEQTKRRSGELQELLTSFVGRGSSVVNDITRGIVSGFSLIAMLGTALAVSPLASLGLFAVMAVLALAIGPFRKVIRRYAKAASAIDLAFATTVSEFTGLGREMQVFGVESAIADELDVIIDQSAHASRKLNFLGFLFTPFYGTMVLLMLVGSLTTVQALGLTDLADLGAVVLVMLRSMAYGQLAQAVVSALMANAPYIEALEDRLHELEGNRVRSEGVAADSIMPIDVDSVSFDYVTGTRALSDVSFTIGSGEIIGVVGPSGSGKSTLVQLLLRLRSPTSGTIAAGGQPISDYALSSWRTATAFVPQDARLIHGTVAENIRFFRPDFTDEEVEVAARLAHIHDDIVTWSDGYQTKIGESGHTVSGGQRQRICIARALLTRPDLLIMDEPTSALDVQSEAKIRDAVAGFRGSTTVVIIAHRLSTVEICDRIMVIVGGELIAFGSPQELRQTDPFYREALELSGLSGLAD